MCVGADVAFVAEQGVFEFDLDREYQRGPVSNSASARLKNTELAGAASSVVAFTPVTLFSKIASHARPLEFFPEPFAFDFVAFDEAE